jgi:hypothetical protein
MSYLKLKNWKTKSIAKLLALALISIGPATVASAQSEAESDREQGAQAEEAEELVTLSEFEVVSARDYGYRATFTSTATKIWDEDINVPVVVSTITREFLDDLQVDDVRKSLDYTSGIFSNLRDTAGPGYSATFGTPPVRCLSGVLPQTRFTATAMTNSVRPIRAQPTWTGSRSSRARCRHFSGKPLRGESSTILRKSLGLLREERSNLPSGNTIICAPCWTFRLWLRTNWGFA